MPKIITTQKNFDGKGNDRVFTRWVKPGQAEITVQRMSRAYKAESTEFSIIED